MCVCVQVILLSEAVSRNCMFGLLTKSIALHKLYLFYQNDSISVCGFLYLQIFLQGLTCIRSTSLEYSSEFVSNEAPSIGLLFRKAMAYKNTFNFKLRGGRPKLFLRKLRRFHPGRPILMLVSVSVFQLARSYLSNAQF